MDLNQPLKTIGDSAKATLLSLIAFLVVTTTVFMFLTLLRPYVSALLAAFILASALHGTKRRLVDAMRSATGGGDHVLLAYLGGSWSGSWWLWVAAACVGAVVFVVASLVVFGARGAAVAAVVVGVSLVLHFADRYLLRVPALFISHDASAAVVVISVMLLLTVTLLLSLGIPLFIEVQAATAGLSLPVLEAFKAAAVQVGGDAWAGPLVEKVSESGLLGPLVEKVREIYRRPTGHGVWTWHDASSILQTAYQQLSHAGVLQETASFAGMVLKGTAASLTGVVSYMVLVLSVVFDMGFNIVFFFTLLFQLLAGAKPPVEFIVGSIPGGSVKSRTDLKNELSGIVEDVCFFPLYIAVLHSVINLALALTLGLELPFLFGTVSFFMALIPVVSPWVGALPWALFLIMGGNITKTCVLLGVNLVSYHFSFDLLSSRRGDNSRITAFACLLGLTTYGFAGLFIAPLLFRISLLAFTKYYLTEKKET